MPITIEDLDDFEDLIQKHDLVMPDGIVFLPRHLESAQHPDELLYESSVTTLAVILRERDIPNGRAERTDARIRLIQENAFELILPAMYIGTALAMSNPEITINALQAIADYAIEFFKGIPGDKKVKFSIVKKDKRSRKCKIYRYNGPPEGLREFRKIIEIDQNDEN